MNDDDMITVPPHLQRLGRSTGEFFVMLSHPQPPASTTPIPISRLFVSRRLGRLARLITILTRWINATRWPTIIGVERVADGLMRLIMWRVRRVLLAMLSEHALLHSVRDTENRQRMAACIAKCYEQVFTELAAKFKEVSAALADPQAALQQQQANVSGSTLVLKTQVTLSAPDMGELVNLARNEWGNASPPQQVVSPVMMRQKCGIGFGEALSLVWLAGTIFERHDGDD